MKGYTKLAGWLLVILILALFAIAGMMRGSPPDACEIACGPVFTECLVDAGTSAETPDPRVERECRRWTERTCIRPCRRGR